MQRKLDVATAQSLLGLKHNHHYQTMVDYLQRCLADTHRRLVASNDFHDTLRLQGEARNLTDVLKLIERAEALLLAHQ